MHNLPDTYSLCGDLLFSPGQSPQTEAWINISAGSITSVGEPAHASRFVLRGYGIVPGLINAHTHLEFSDLGEPLGTPGMRLPDWIGEVFSWRDSSDKKTAEERMSDGIYESLEAGVVAVGDIISDGGVPENPPLHYIAFEELIATRSEQFASVCERAREHGTAEPSARVRIGLSPHAPYSVAAPVWDEAVAVSKDHNIPLAVHLAETREELTFLASGSGPFAELLAARDAKFVPAGKRPLDFLRRLAAASRTLIAHGNYLADEEIEFLAQHSDRFTIVYCPRTHAYFGHDPYPLAALLAANLNVAVGTDGRGSNPDLNVFSELQFVASQFPEIDGQTVLRMGTLAGAMGLGLDDRLGTIEAGKEASFAIVQLTEASDPYERLFHPQSKVAATFVAGQLAAGEFEAHSG